MEQNVLAWGMLVAYSLVSGITSAIISIIDFNNFITIEGKGTAPLQYYRSFHAILFTIIMGVLGVVFFFLSISLIPIDEISSNTFSYTFNQNPFFYSIGIGVLTKLIIRSKLFEFGGYKFGLEEIYIFLLNGLANGYKSKASIEKFKLAKIYSEKISDHEKFQDEILSFVRDSINHRKDEEKNSFENDISTLSLGQNILEKQLSQYKISLCIDYLDIRKIQKFCNNYFSQVL